MGYDEKVRKAALYVRVSTDRQTVANQIEALAVVLVDRSKLDAARKLLAAGTGILKTAQAVGLVTGTVHRLKQSMA